MIVRVVARTLLPSSRAILPSPSCTARQSAAAPGCLISAKVLQPLLDHLSAKNSVRLIGPKEAKDRAPTVAVELEVPCGSVASELAALGINCDGGDFYAGRALAGVGIDPDQGVLRMSFVHYTSEADIARLIDGLDCVLG